MIENGIILVDKPTGMTSFGVVARLRRILTKHYGHKVKVGHSGTLDPFATGLMVILVGNECKQAQKYTKLDKVYEANIRLGEASSTGDPEGDITKVSDIRPEKQAVTDCLDSFIGKQNQIPPIYSAIKIGGERAYKLARNGRKVEMPIRQIEIYDINLFEYDYPDLKIQTHVSSGTYIRSLAEDIGKSLGTGAYLTDLRRTKVGDFDIAKARRLKDFGISD